MPEKENIDLKISKEKRAYKTKSSVYTQTIIKDEYGRVLKESWQKQKGSELEKDLLGIYISPKDAEKIKLLVQNKVKGDVFLDKYVELTAKYSKLYTSLEGNVFYLPPEKGRKGVSGKVIDIDPPFPKEEDEEIRLAPNGSEDEIKLD